ncbi:MAG: Uma2 family endonuclease [Gemmatales bacterium]|nr:Uma2 family endonuclease [Gemmatales bacterium]MDW8176506.1 Uma2 family endonuclease [Gemmatales bacterium]
MTVVPCGESLAPAHQDTSPLLTAEESWQLRQQPKFADQLLELDEIELVIVSPPGAQHGRVGSRLARILDEYIFQLGRGALIAHDTGLLIHRDPDTVLGPNLIVYADPMDWEDLPEGWLGKIPPLVVEIVSPSEDAARLASKVAKYLQAGVNMVCMVEPHTIQVQAHCPGTEARILNESDTLTGSDVMPGFVCTVADLLRLPGA